MAEEQGRGGAAARAHAAQALDQPGLCGPPERGSQKLPLPLPGEAARHRESWALLPRGRESWASAAAWRETQAHAAVCCGAACCAAQAPGDEAVWRQVLRLHLNHSSKEVATKAAVALLSAE